MTRESTDLADLEARIERIERLLGIEESDETELMADGFDHRDRTVLLIVAANDPDVVTLRDLRNAYRENTDIRSDETLRDRIRFLVTNGPFEKSASRKWRYMG